MDLTHRPRRLRKNAVIREALAETRVHAAQFIYPYFMKPGENKTVVLSGGQEDSKRTRLLALPLS